MGLGKTVSTLWAIERFEPSDFPVLIVAPVQVARTVWIEEAKKFGINKTIVNIQGTPERRSKIVASPADIYTISYELLPWLVDVGWKFSTVIADESTKLKGFRTRQGTKRARALASVMLQVKRFVALTGTPTPNGLIDLWGQLWFVDFGQRLGTSFSKFTERYFRQGFNGYGYTPMPHAQNEVQGTLKDICLTIDSKDYFDLKIPIVTNVYVDLPPKVREFYKTFERDMYAEFSEEGVSSFSAAEKTIKCLQAANGAVYLKNNPDRKYLELHDEKIEALKGIIESANGASVLVVYYFRSDLERIQKAIPSELISQDNVKRWNEGQIPVLVVHPAAAGHGLNLQYGGNIIVFFGLWWNLEERLQVIERIGPVRQMQAGFNRNVFVYNILARDTLDSLVLRAIEYKKRVQDVLLEALKSDR